MIGNYECQRLEFLLRVSRDVCSSTRVKVHNNLEIKDTWKYKRRKNTQHNHNINTNPGNSGEKQIR
jgi:hypothetical protein